MKRSFVKVVLSAVLVFACTGCTAAHKDLSARLEALEAKTNEAMQTAATAKVDAKTALHISVPNQEKLESLEVKTNEVAQTAATAKVDAKTALHISVENQQKLKKMK